jgi:hypothetical protein
MLRDLAAVLAGLSPVDGLGGRIGNESLDTGRESCVPVHSHPLPLPEILDEIYRSMEVSQ